MGKCSIAICSKAGIPSWFGRHAPRRRGRIATSKLIVRLWIVSIASTTRPRWFARVRIRPAISAELRGSKWCCCRPPSLLAPYSTAAILGLIVRAPCTRHTNPASWDRLSPFWTRANRVPPRRVVMPSKDQPPNCTLYRRQHDREGEP